MKYFINKTNQIFAFESDGSQDEFIDDDLQPISKEEADRIISDLQKQNQKILTYADKRRFEYPPIGDQLDALWKGGAAQEEMAQRVKAVKDKYPKPE